MHLHVRRVEVESSHRSDADLWLARERAAPPTITVLVLYSEPVQCSSCRYRYMEATRLGGVMLIDARMPEPRPT